MKWVAAILMIINVAVFLSAGTRSENIQPYKNGINPDVNKQGMLLLSETNEVVTQSDNDVVTGIDGIVESPEIVSKAALVQNAVGSLEIKNIETTNGNGEANNSSDTEGTEVLTTGQTEDSKVALACLRIGPFKSESTWRTATNWAKEQEIEFQTVSTQSRELHAVRIYLGPFTSAATTEAVIKNLKEKELDYFVYETTTGAKRISLGYFTQEKLAAQYLERLESIDAPANSEPEYRTLGPLNWMEISVEPTQQELLNKHNWGDSSINVSHFDC